MAFLFLVFATFAHAAECSPAEFQKALKRVKLQAVYELDSGMLLSTMDETEFAQAVKAKTPDAGCAGVALSLTDAVRVAKISSLPSSVRNLVCGTKNLSLVFNVNPHQGVTTFVRVNRLGVPELSVGGTYDTLPAGGAKGCEQAFLANLERNALEAIDQVGGLPPESNPEDVIRNTLGQVIHPTPGGAEPGCSDVFK